MSDTGTVTFFLYFTTGGEAAECRDALVAAGGCKPQEILPPEDPTDQTWSLAVERVVHTEEVVVEVDWVRAMAEASGGELDGIVTPWPAHPHGFPPQRPVRG